MAATRAVYTVDKMIDLLKGAVLSGASPEGVAMLSGFSRSPGLFVLGSIAIAGLTTAVAALLIEWHLYERLRADVQRRADSAASVAAAELEENDFDVGHAAAHAHARRDRIRGQFIPFHAVNIRYGKLHRGRLHDAGNTEADAVEVSIALSRRYGNPHRTVFGHLLGWDAVDLEVSSVVRLNAQRLPPCTGCEDLPLALTPTTAD